MKANFLLWVIVFANLISAAHAYEQLTDQHAIERVAHRYGLYRLSGANDAVEHSGQTGILLNQPSTARDKAGLRRDTYYFLGYQLAVIAVLYVMPESVSGWSEEQKDERRLRIWWDNISNPEWDTDDLFINYVLHPYWGATYFVRARERGYSNRQSLYYSAILSTLYEFGVEAIFENPSIQDFFVTPIAGYYLGKYFMQVREDIRDKVRATGMLSTRDKWILALTDPLGSMNRYIDHKLGKQAQLDMHLLAMHSPEKPYPGADRGTPVGVGARFTLRF